MSRLYYGWYVLAAVCGINFANGATAIGVLTVFMLPLTAAFGWTRTEISVATSIGAVLGAVAAPLTGRLSDRFGARLPLTLGGVLVVLATLYLAAMDTLTGFYVAFSLARLADQGFVQALSPPAVAKWFRRYRGRAMAVLFFTTSAGGIVLPLVVQLLIETWHWRAAWVGLSGLMLGLGVLPCAVLVRRQPEDLGLPVDGLPVCDQSGAAAVAASESRSFPDEVSWRLGEAAATPALWCFLASVFVIGMTSTGIGLHLVPYLVQHELSPALAVGAVSLGFVAAGAGNLFWGTAADRLSVRLLLLLTYVLKILSLAVLLATDTVVEAYLFALLQGFADGGMRTLMALLLAEDYGRQHLGAIYGLMRAAQVGGFAIGPLISGMTYDATQSYFGAFVAFFTLSLVGLGLILLARPPVRSA